MAHMQGFLTNAANPRQAIYELLKPFLLANGFTMIKDYGVVNASTQACVLRHTASGTALVIGYTSMTYINTSPCEDFIPETDTIVGPMWATNANRTYDATGKTTSLTFVPTTYTTWWNNQQPSSNSTYQFVVYGDAYAIIIDTVAVAMDSYTPLTPAADSPPNFGGWSNTLYQVGSRVHNVSTGGTIASNSLSSVSNVLGVFGDINAIDPYTGARPLLRVPRLPLAVAGFLPGIPSASSVLSKPIGIYSTLRGVVIGSSPTNGDTITDGSTVYSILPTGSSTAQLILRRE